MREESVFESYLLVKRGPSVQLVQVTPGPERIVLTIELFQSPEENSPKNLPKRLEENLQWWAQLLRVTLWESVENLGIRNGQDHVLLRTLRPRIARPDLVPATVPSDSPPCQTPYRTHEPTDPEVRLGEVNVPAGTAGRALSALHVNEELMSPVDSDRLEKQRLRALERVRAIRESIDAEKRS